MSDPSPSPVDPIVAPLRRPAWRVKSRRPVLIAVLVVVGLGGVALWRQRRAASRGGHAAPLLRTSSLHTDIVPASDTLVVSPRMIGGFVTLSAPLERAVRVRGRAPMAGTVLQVMVRPGQHVALSTQILQLSTTSSRNASKRAEAAQDKAESGQVAAVDEKDALQQRLLVARNQLAAAQQRVANAHKRHDAARRLLEKVQQQVEGGGTGDATAAPAYQAAKDASAGRKAAPSAAAPDDHELHRALVAADGARRAVAKMEERAAAASRLAHSAADDRARKMTRVDEMRAAADKVQKLFDSGTARASDVDAARANLEDAQAEAQSAGPRVVAAQREEARLADAAAQARTDAQRLSRAAAQLSKQAAGAAAAAGATPEAGNAAGADDSDTSGGRPVTLEDAAREVRASIAESDAAAADAISLKASVDEYDRQVRQTRTQLSTTSEKLAGAQERVVDETIEHNLSQVRAPAAGTVLSVARLHQTVDQGEVIVQIGRAGVLQVRLLDSSDAWSGLQPGDSFHGRALPAAVPSPARPPSPVPSPSTSPSPSPSSSPTSVRTASPGPTPAAGDGGIAVMGRVTEIEPPDFRHKQAVITADIEPAATAAGKVLQLGMTVVCSLVRPGHRAAMLVPTTSILPVRDGVGTVAVLAPQGEPVPVAGPAPGAAAPAATASSAASASAARSTKAPDGGPVPAVQPRGPATAPPLANLPCHIEWREVRLGAGDGVQQEIALGLAPGERIALRPERIKAYALATGNDEIQVQSRL